MTVCIFIARNIRLSFHFQIDGECVLYLFVDYIALQQRCIGYQFFCTFMTIGHSLVLIEILTLILMRIWCSYENSISYHII